MPAAQPHPTRAPARLAPGAPQDAAGHAGAVSRQQSRNAPRRDSAARRAAAATVANGAGSAREPSLPAGDRNVHAETDEAKIRAFEQMIAEQEERNRRQLRQMRETLASLSARVRRHSLGVRDAEQARSPGFQDSGLSSSMAMEYGCDYGADGPLAFAKKDSYGAVGRRPARLKPPAREEEEELPDLKKMNPTQIAGVLRAQTQWRMILARRKKEMLEVEAVTGSPLKGIIMGLGLMFGIILSIRLASPPNQSDMSPAVLNITMSPEYVWQYTPFPDWAPEWLPAHLGPVQFIVVVAVLILTLTKMLQGVRRVWNSFLPPRWSQVSFNEQLTIMHKKTCMPNIYRLVAVTQWDEIRRSGRSPLVLLLMACMSAYMQLHLPYHLLANEVNDFRTIGWKSAAYYETRVFYILTTVPSMFTLSFIFIKTISNTAAEEVLRSYFILTAIPRGKGGCSSPRAWRATDTWKICWCTISVFMFAYSSLVMICVMLLNIATTSGDYTNFVLRVMSNFFIVNLPDLIVKTFPRIEECYVRQFKQHDPTARRKYTVFEYLKPLYFMLIDMQDVLLVVGLSFVLMTYWIDFKSGAHVGPFVNPALGLK